MLLWQKAPPRPNTIVKFSRDKVKERLPLSFDNVMSRWAD